MVDQKEKSPFLRLLNRPQPEPPTTEEVVKKVGFHLGMAAGLCLRLIKDKLKEAVNGRK